MQSLSLSPSLSLLAHSLSLLAHSDQPLQFLMEVQAESPLSSHLIDTQTHVISSVTEQVYHPV